MTIEPANRAVYAIEPIQPAHGGAAAVAGLPCAMGLVVKQGDSYAQYALSGGP
jgi:hypothetical protein